MISSRLSLPAGRRPRPPPAGRPRPSSGEPVPLIGGCTPLTFPQTKNNSSTYVELTPRGDPDAASFDPRPGRPTDASSAGGGRRLPHDGRLRRERPERGIAEPR